jgi:hypothetical protein
MNASGDRRPPRLQVNVMVAGLAWLAACGALTCPAEAAPAPAGKTVAREQARLTAEALVEQGYTLRGDSWSGEALAGGRVGIRHQLFRGNEYVFTLGTAVPADIQLAIFTSNREPVPTEVTAGEQTASVRFNPPATATYLIVFTLVSREHERIPWSLVYAYR